MGSAGVCRKSEERDRREVAEREKTRRGELSLQNSQKSSAEEARGGEKGGARLVSEGGGETVGEERRNPPRERNGMAKKGGEQAHPRRKARQVLQPDHENLPPPHFSLARALALHPHGVCEFAWRMHELSEARSLMWLLATLERRESPASPHPSPAVFTPSPTFLPSHRSSRQRASHRVASMCLHRSHISGSSVLDTASHIVRAALEGARASPQAAPVTTTHASSHGTRSTHGATMKHTTPTRKRRMLLLAKSLSVHCSSEWKRTPATARRGQAKSIPHACPPCCTGDHSLASRMLAPRRDPEHVHVGLVGK